MKSAVQGLKTVSLNAVMGYKHQGLVERLQEKEGMSKEEASKLFQDMLRFLYLCATSKKIMGPSPRIDVAWHHFILFTKDYQKFCRVFLGRFVHHCPISKDKKAKGGNGVAKNTLIAAQKAFGKLTDNWIYPSLTADCSDSCSGTTNCQDADCHDS